MYDQALDTLLSPQLIIDRYIQMAGMLFGGMVEADSRMRAYEQNVRRWKRVARDAEVWRRYEQDYEEKGVPGISSEGDVGTGDSVAPQEKSRKD